MSEHIMLRRCAALVALLMPVAVILAAGQAQKRDVDIKAPDGVLLKATYFSPGAPGPAILLLHQCSMTRHAWDDLGADLSHAGIHVLAFDYRGYGDSKGTLPPPPPQPAGTDRRFGPTISGSWVANTDVELAYAYLRSQDGVDRARVAVGGASCGAQFAADLVIHHPEMKALFLVSGRISDSAAAHIAATSWLAVLGAAAQEDMPIAYEGVRDAIATSKNPASMMKMFPGRGHGVEMFATDPGLRPLIVRWVQKQLKP